VKKSFNFQSSLSAFPSALKSVYFGGGTPSLATRSEIEQILSFLPLENDTEVTLEVNPNDCDHTMADLRRMGITRVR
jgi:oxygen-independent coproporphyrinogen-3 oxidase